MGNTSAKLFSKAYINQLHTVAARLLQDDNKTGGTITLPVKEGNQYVSYTIPFYLKDNFSFSLGNTWNPLLDLSDLDMLTKGLNTYFAIKGGTQMTLQSKAMSSVVWAGSDIPSFSIQTVFVCVSREYNPLEIINVLAASCLPNLSEEVIQKNKEFESFKNTGAGVVEGVGSATGNVINMFGANSVGDTIIDLSQDMSNVIKQSGLYAPLEFAIENQGLNARPNSTLGLRIGNWFQASDLVMEKISNISFSKEVIAERNSEINKNGATDTYRGNSLTSENASGFPVYVECTLQLRPIQLVTASDFSKYFIGLNSTNENAKGGNSPKENIKDAEISR